MTTTATTDEFNDIVLIGRGRLVASIPACLAIADSTVSIVSGEPEQDYLRTQKHINQSQKYIGKEVRGTVRFVKNVNDVSTPDLVIIIGYSDVHRLRAIIGNLESHFDEDLTIAVATDHIPLSEIQKRADRPGNILVMNWAEPAHTTFFLEIVHNEVTNPEIVSTLKHIAIKKWEKDPYVIQAETGIRGRMQTAMIREAMYLVEEGYADVQDIDRACRNDAGTYLPFAGHFQYMDLMGTYAYGVVMEKLNKELSNAKKIPVSFRKTMSNSHNGMSGGNEFYGYTEEEMKEWEIKAREFSFEIRELMKKYL